MWCTVAEQKLAGEIGGVVCRIYVACENSTIDSRLEHRNFPLPQKGSDWDMKVGIEKGCFVEGCPPSYIIDLRGFMIHHIFIGPR